MAKHWYAYVGPCPLTRSTDAFAVSNYAYTTLSEQLLIELCLGGTCPCAIYATGFTGPGAPPVSPLSANIRQYLRDALLTQSPYPSASRAYAFVKQ